MRGSTTVVAKYEQARSCQVGEHNDLSRTPIRILRLFRSNSPHLIDASLGRS